MKKKDNKNQEYKGFQWFLMLPLIPLIIFSVLMLGNKCDSTTENWIALVTSCVSSFATIILGLLVYFQTKNYRENDEQQEKKYREEQEKNRNQELCLKANPSICFNKIESINISLSSFIVGQQSYVNRLMDEKPSKDVSCYDCNICFELIFNKINNSIVDKIHIEKARLSCHVGDFPFDEYKVLYEKDYINFILDRDKANIKIGTNGEIISHLSLLSCQTKEVETDDILSLDDEYKDRDTLLTAFQTQNARGSLNIYYTVSNVFGVAISYKTQISFAIKNCIYDGNYDYCIVIDNQNICTWQTDEIHKENKNEFNA